MSLVSCETPWNRRRSRCGPRRCAFWIRPGRDVDDLGLAVGAVGDHAGLAAGEGPGRLAEVRDRHRHQRHRDPLARGEQHVELAGRRQRAHLLGEVAQLVGVVAHRGDHHDDVLAGLLRGDDPLGDALDAVGVGDGRAAVLLHDNAHDTPERLGRTAAPDAAILPMRPCGPSAVDGWQDGPGGGLSAGRGPGSPRPRRPGRPRSRTPRRAGRGRPPTAAPAGRRSPRCPTSRRRRTATTTAPR